MRKTQFLAILLAGVMALGGLSATAYASEADVSAVSIEEVATFSAEALAPASEEIVEAVEEPVTAPETTPEVTPEVTPETTPEVTPETTPEVTPETTPEATPEATPEVTPETTPEATPEATPDVTPETTPEVQNPAGESVVTPTPTVEATATPTPTPELFEGESLTDTGIKVGAKYFTSLQYAVNYIAANPEMDGTIQKVTVIEVTQNLVLTETVTVPASVKVCIRAKAAVIISRDASFDDTMFEVGGTGSELHFDVDKELSASLLINGDNGSAGADMSVGSIVSITDNGLFALLDGVTLTGNTTTADGAAISNAGGNIILQGGSINGNTGSKGAVYSNTNIYIEGTVTVKDNNNHNEQTANIYLAAPAVMNIIGTMSGSEVGLTVENGAENSVVSQPAYIGTANEVSMDVFKTAMEQFAYDDNAFIITIDEANKWAALAADPSITVTPTPTPDPSVTPSATPTPSPTPSPTPTPVINKNFLSYKTETRKWYDHNTYSVDMTTEENCGWYYFYVEAGTSTDEIKKKYDANHPLTSAKANTTFTVKAENVPEGKTWLVVYAESDAGAKQMKVISMTESLRPAAPTPTPLPITPTQKPSRDPYRPAVTESTVSGLNQPLEFYPNKFYKFTVTGAGTNNTNPIAGDEKWVPLYWGTSTTQKNYTWQIGAAKGIKEANTYPLYITFEKYTYNGSSWVTTGVQKTLTFKFQSAAISDEAFENYVAENDGTDTDETGNGTGTGTGTGNGGNISLDGSDLDYGTDGSSGSGAGSGGNYVGSGDSSDPEDGADATAKDTNETTKSAVDTGDETPIGTFVMLAAAAIFVCGWIVSKRKENH